MSSKNNLITGGNTVILTNSCDSGMAIEDRDSIDAVVDAFLSDQQVMETSRRAYGWEIRRFFGWCRSAGRKMDELRRADIVAYIRDMSENGYSARTIMSYTVAVRRFFAWLESRGISANIVSGVKSPGYRKSGFVKMHLDRDERAGLLEYARKRGPRDYAIINLMMRNGLRTIEVSRLDTGDITYRRGTRIMKVWRKGAYGKDDFVVLTDEAYGPIEEYLSGRGNVLPGSPLFVTGGKGHRNGRMSPRRIQQIVKDGLRSIGLVSREYSPHSLRHTTAVAVLEGGGSIFDVQKVLGHASSSTSQIYVKSVEEQMRLDNAPENIIRDAFDRHDNK